MRVLGEPVSDLSPAEDSALLPLCIIIAAHNEEGYIGACLNALLLQDESAGPVHIIVAANACTDQTGPIVIRYQSHFAERNWRLELLEIPVPGKLKAFNEADQLAARSIGGARIYLDADVICNPDLIGQLRKALSLSNAVYATGTLRVIRARSWITRRYADIWVRLPFIQAGAVGAGLFAVNAAGRARWGEFPDIISDDTFARLNFSPAERIEVSACYHWPMVEGLRNLIRVRRRQDAGVEEVKRLFPDLIQNDDKVRLTKPALLRLALQKPIGFVIYVLVHLAVRLQPGGAEWTRGR